MSEPAASDATGAALHGVNAYWRALDAAAITRGEHRAFVGGLWDDLGALQLAFLEAHGLEPRHRLLDVGCGALRGGVHFIPYLEPGHYCGIDANASLLEAGQHELALAGIDARGVNLLASADFEVGRFGQHFEYAIAVSVFTHLYLNHIQQCLVRVAEVLAPGGRFFATYFEAPGRAWLEPVSHLAGIVTSYGADPFHQSFDELATLAEAAGLRAERIGDFGHPRGQFMAVFHKP